MLAAYTVDEPRKLALLSLRFEFCVVMLGPFDSSGYLGTFDWDWVDYVYYSAWVPSRGCCWD